MLPSYRGAHGTDKKETGKKAGGVAASLVGERRKCRTFAQQHPNDSGRSRVKQKSKTKFKPFQKESKTKAKAEFR